MRKTVLLLGVVVTVLALTACANPTPAQPTEAPVAAAPTAPVLPTQAPPAAAPTTLATIAAAKDAVPAVQVVPLQKGTTFAVGQSIGVAVFCADSDGIASAGMTVDSEVVSSLQGNNQTILQGTLTWTPDKPGKFNLGVIAYDKNSQVATLKIQEVTIVPAGSPLPPTTTAAATTTPAPDTEPPAVSIASMASEWTDGSDVVMSVNAVDASGVAKLELYIDGAVVDTWNYDAAAGPAPQSAFVNLTWPGAKEGDHAVYVAGTDTVGNVGQSVEQTVTVLP